MAKKYSSESSDYDVRDQRDRHHRTHAKNGSKSDTRRDHADKSDSSGSDEGNRTKGYGRYNNRRGDDKDKERATSRGDKDGERMGRRDAKNENGRKKTENQDTKTFQLRTDEDKDQMERYIPSQDDDDSGHHETRKGDKISRYHQHTEEESERRTRDQRGREKSHHRESGRRRQETEDGYRHRENSSRRHHPEDDDRREEHRESTWRRDKKGDDKQGRYRSEEASESIREKSKGDGKVLESSKPQVQSTTQETKNADTSILGKSGGVYIPPFKLARMMKEVQDKSSVEYQRLTWDALRKSINGLVNKVNAANIKNITPELFQENLIRGRGLFCRSCMKSQMAAREFTSVFAALVAVVNTKFPEIGDLLLRRVVLQLKRAYKRNDKV